MAREFFYETTARSLIQDEDGAVIGVRCAGPGHKSLELRAPSVVLASGGFEGNPEMLTHYLGPRARYIRPVARGGYYNKGEGIRMALAIGAAACGDYGSFHAEPLDPRSGATEPVVLVFNYGILVNKLGAAFRQRGAGDGRRQLRGDHPRHLRAAGRHRLLHLGLAHRRGAELAALGALRPAADRGRHLAGAGAKARPRCARVGGDGRGL